MEDGYNLIPRSSIEGDEILFKAGLFFHDVGKSEITIQTAFYNQKNPPISHTHLSFIFFYSWLKDFFKKELIDLLKNDKVRIISFGILSHHSPPHCELDYNIFSQLFTKNVTISEEIFDILLKYGFSINKETLKETYIFFVNGYKNNYIEFPFKYYLNHNLRKDFVIFYNALVKADWNSVIGKKERFLSTNDLKNIKLPSIVEPKRSKVHSYIYKKPKFKENILLELPTGFGKTYLGFGYGMKTNRRRIIYTLPVTTIIEDVYNNITRIIGDSSVEWYTSRYLVLKSLKKETSQRAYIEARYFEKPIIITTLDQVLLAFLGVDRYPLKEAGLYDSCIILDEPQLYSPLMLFLFSEFLPQYIDKFNFIIMTATFPTFFKKKIKNFIKEPFLKDKESIFKNLPRVYFDQTLLDQTALSQNVINQDLVKLVKKFLSEGKRIAIIFNTVRKAQEFYKILHLKNSKKFLFHARFIYRDRFNLLKNLKEKLKNPPIVVISTQAIEAGVNISFDVMFREIAPFDSLIQSAGRVNRFFENQTSCPVYVFGTVNDFYPYKKYQLEITARILDKLKINTELDLLIKLQEYWEKLEIYLSKDEEKAKKLAEAVKEISPFSLDIDESNVDLRDSYFKISAIPIKFYHIVKELWEEYKKINKKNYWERKKLLSEIESYMVEIPYWGKVNDKRFKDFIIEEEKIFRILTLKYDNILGVLPEEDINSRCL
ncbi:CRISPR-associated helicase Cas3' [Candidatus Aminicenantes bacterium AC-335-L06]|nr:CRISPR-associated helicase Cas3' [Candidatus Aminicenantes bacterium AC-335-L06]